MGNGTITSFNSDANQTVNTLATENGRPSSPTSQTVSNQQHGLLILDQNQREDKVSFILNNPKDGFDESITPSTSNETPQKTDELKRKYPHFSLQEVIVKKQRPQRPISIDTIADNLRKKRIAEIGINQNPRSGSKLTAEEIYYIGKKLSDLRKESPGKLTLEMRERIRESYNLTNINTTIYSIDNIFKAAESFLKEECTIKEAVKKFSIRRKNATEIINAVAKVMEQKDQTPTTSGMAFKSEETRNHTSKNTDASSTQADPKIEKKIEEKLAMIDKEFDDILKLPHDQQGEKIKELIDNLGLTVNFVSEGVCKANGESKEKRYDPRNRLKGQSELTEKNKEDTKKIIKVILEERIRKDLTISKEELEWVGSVIRALDSWYSNCSSQKRETLKEFSKKMEIDGPCSTKPLQDAMLNCRRTKGWVPTLKFYSLNMSQIDILAKELVKVMPERSSLLTSRPASIESNEEIKG